MLNEQRERIKELEKNGTPADLPEVREIRAMAMGVRDGISDMMPSAGGGYAIQTHMLSRGITDIIDSCDILIKVWEAK
jgi:hypothetical protein